MVLIRLTIPRKPANLVIPAKAGTQCLCSLLLLLATTDPHPSVFHAHPCARVTFSCLPKRK